MIPANQIILDVFQVSNRDYRTISIRAGARYMRGPLSVGQFNLYLDGRTLAVFYNCAASPEMDYELMTNFSGSELILTVLPISGNRAFFGEIIVTKSSYIT